MKARIVSFRRARHHQYKYQMLVQIEGIGSREQAAQLIGSRIIWTSPAGKKIFGKISSPHGHKGVVRARFSKGLPGQSITQPVKIISKSAPAQPAAKPAAKPVKAQKAEKAAKETKAKKPAKK